MALPNAPNPSRWRWQKQPSTIPSTEYPGAHMALTRASKRPGEQRSLDDGLVVTLPVGVTQSSLVQLAVRIAGQFF